MYVAKGNTPCLTMDPDIWMSKPDSTQTQYAKSLCLLTCPEMQQCLRSTLRHEKRAGVNDGVFGGLTREERSKLIA